MCQNHANLSDLVTCRRFPLMFLTWHNGDHRFRMWQLPDQIVHPIFVISSLLITQPMWFWLILRFPYDNNIMNSYIISLFIFWIWERPFQLIAKLHVLSHYWMLLNTTVYLVWAARPNHVVQGCDFDKLHQDVVLNPSAPLGHVANFMEND